MNKQALYNLTYGLFVVTSNKVGLDSGCIINTALQVTSQPNRIAIAINKSNYTHDLVRDSGKFNISILSEKTTFDLIKHFGFQSGRDVNKFENYQNCKRSSNQLYYILEGSNAYISVKVEEMIDVGTHTMFIGIVEDMEILSQDPSLTYQYYLDNIKSNAMTNNMMARTNDMMARTNDKVGWYCTICGYIYEGEILPDDYICPICKHPASDFIPLK